MSASPRGSSPGEAARVGSELLDLTDTFQVGDLVLAGDPGVMIAQQSTSTGAKHITVYLRHPTTCVCCIIHINKYCMNMDNSRNGGRQTSVPQ